MEIALTATEYPVEREAPFSVDQGKTYVAHQVRRWEQVTLEFVMSPTIEYTWPHPNPDFKSYLVRLAPNAVVDFTSVEVYLKDLSPRDCPDTCVTTNGAEGAHTALESARVEFEERWQQREAKAEAEKVAWVADVQKTLSVQLEAFQQKLHSLEEARNRDQETIRDLQNVQGMHLRNTPATHPQAQDTRATYGSDSATQVKSEPTQSDWNKYAKEDEAVKSEQTLGAKSSSVSRPKSQVRETKPVAPGKTDAKKPAKKDSNKKHSLPVYTTTAAMTQGGSVVTLRTFTITLEDFDEKLSLSARRRWWERFLNVTVQGGWTDQMKVYELKTKMSPAVRNWYGQLSKHVRSEWSRLSKEFKHEYCKSRVSESEKYYTMKQFKDETALAFLYRLNLAAERADVRFRKSERRREQHIKRFIKNLTDVTLKTTLQSQRFRKVSDLEYVLKQQEEVNPNGVHSGRGAQPRDFRADNVARNGSRMNRPNRAYVAQDDEAQGSDTQVTFEDGERANLAALSTCVQDVLRDGNPDARLLTREDLIHEVYRVMNSVG
ncbi:hypothetical protein PHPALM_30827, partial [Phytophthora palmivora]